MDKFLLKLYRFGKIGWLDRDRSLGNYYGYPKCCVDNFVKLQSIRLPPAIAMSAVLGIDIGGPDYVRCAECRGVVVSEEQSLNKFYKIPEEY